MDRMLRTRLATVVVLTAVFSAGVLLGLAADRTMGAAPAAEGTGDQDEGRQERRPALYEQVNPTDEQRVAIDSIVAEMRTAMRALHAEFRAAYDTRYAALINETRYAIRGVLTPEQAQAYDSLVAERDRQRAEREARDDGN
jgi:Spy/CpxP family protein refolding chaperone